PTCNVNFPAGGRYSPYPFQQATSEAIAYLAWKEDRLQDHPALRSAEADNYFCQIEWNRRELIHDLRCAHYLRTFRLCCLNRGDDIRRFPEEFVHAVVRHTGRETPHRFRPACRSLPEIFPA